MNYGTIILQIIQFFILSVFNVVFWFLKPKEILFLMLQTADAIFVGYSPDHKAYRCYVPDLQDIVISNNVKFQDDYFPYRKKRDMDKVEDQTKILSDIYAGAAAGGAYLPVDITNSSGIYSGELTFLRFESTNVLPSTPPELDSILSETPNEEANIDTTVAIEEGIGLADENENVNLDVGIHRPLNQSSQDEDSGPQLASMEMLDEYDSAEDEDYVPNETASDISSVTGRSETQTETTTVLAGTELDDYFDYMNEHDLFHNVHAPMMPYMLEQGDLLDDIQMVESNFEIMTSNNILNEDSEVINILPDASSTENSLTRTISEVTDTDGPDAKRQHTGSSFHVLNAVHKVINDSSTSDYIPSSLPEALSGPDSKFWSDAIEKELQAHVDNNTWELCTLPAHRRAIGCRWVFTIKDLTTPPTYKARLVAQGFRQIQGIDYGETFSPVVRYESIRVLFALAAQFKLKIHQMDVTTAFLNGDLEEEIYMVIPQVFELLSTKCVV